MLVNLIECLLLEMNTLDPKVIAVFFIKNFLGTVYVLPLWFIGVSIFEHVWLANIGLLPKDVFILLLDGAGVIFFAILIMACYYWSWLSYINYSYDLQPDGLHIQSGVIIRRHNIIPYSDIENVELLINPFIVRFLQLFTVQIKSREVLNSEGLFKKKQLQFIPGLTSETARSLRAELLRDTHLKAVKKTFFDPVTGNYR